MIVFPLLKLASQHGLDAVNLCGDVAGREPGDFSDRCSVETFEVRENHVPVERLQSLNQMKEPIQGLTAVGGLRASGCVGQGLQFFEADQRLRSGATLPQD